MYSVSLNKKVKKFLASHKELAKLFYQKLTFLSEGDFQSLDVKKLQGQKNKYRLRIGKYRFLYEIIEDKILIYFYDVNSRGDIY